MKTSYRWLRDLVPGLELSPEELAEWLALRGAPVEEIRSAAEGLDDVVVGKVVDAGPHPNADRLTLCRVDGGAGVVSVVCGAPNVKPGAYYPFAPVGAVLPGGVKIKKAKIRGEVSEGMLCSAKELGLGTDHTGILELPGSFTPGVPLTEALGLDDWTLDVEVTANRGDLLSHVGVAREVAPAGEGRVKLPAIEGAPEVELPFAVGTEEVASEAARIRIEAPRLCHRYLGAVIRGVQVGPSPLWLQARLRGAGARPINNVVDATNYVMLELGQPLHAFDLQRLDGGTVVVRTARPEESTFTTLDEQERALTTDTLMICDATQPVAIAGVMGGLDSEVTDATTDVLLECALFDPKSIRATRRRLGMSTDASYRFERGVDPEGMETAVRRAVALILATAGGRVDGPVLDCCPVPFQPQVVELRLERVRRVLGVGFDAGEVERLLHPLGFGVEAGERDGTLRVRIPGFRSYDVTREIDVIEEIARTHGYDRFPSELGPFRPGTVPDHPLFGLEDRLRRLLAARGLLEAQTPAFVPEGEGDVRVQNPVSAAEPMVRKVLLPSLLRRLEYNLARGNRDVRLFELGTSFHKAGAGEPPHEEPHLAVVLHGRRTPPHWSGPAPSLDVYDLKAIFEDVVRAAYGEAWELRPLPEGDGVPAHLVRETVLAAVVGDEVVGHAGAVDRHRLDLPPWAGEVWGLELTLPAEPASAPPVTFRPLPQMPAVERDLALLVPAGVQAQQVLDVIRSAGGELLEHVEIFDLYEGPELGQGVRSLAFRLRFRAPHRTLKDKEVDRAVERVRTTLKESLGVEQRG